MNRFFETNRVAAQAPHVAGGGRLPDRAYRYSLPASQRPEAGESGGADGHGSMGTAGEALGSGRGDSTAIRRARIETQSRQIKLELEQASYVKMIVSYEKNFDQLLKDFMERLAKNARFQYNSHLANLVTRLDYNMFFTVSAGSADTA
jgi:hypothetical protein